MKSSAIFWFFSLALLLSSCDSETSSQAKTSTSRDAEIEQIFADYKAFCMRNYHEWAGYEGDHRNADKLTDDSEEAHYARLDSNKKFRDLVGGINGEDLSAENRLNLLLFFEMLNDEVDGERFKHHYMPLTQQGGIHIGLPQMINYCKLETFDDFEIYLLRLNAITKKVDDAIQNMRMGMEIQLNQPRFVVEQIIEQIEGILNTPSDSLAFVLPLYWNETLNEGEKKELKGMLVGSMDDVVKPAYEKLHAFVKDEYLATSRENPGVWALPEGEDRYREAIKYHTTLPMEPDEIFEIGMAEVQRITTLMEEVMEATGFEGSRSEFFEYVRTDSQFYYSDKEELMQGFRDILKVMDTKLPDLFGILPEAPYELKEMEAYRAASAPQAYYYSAPEDRSRPGYFYVNTYNLPSRPKYTMTALALHEAVPGHHLQITIAQELEGLPWFRENLPSTAYVEGWGLYAEYLGYESDMYKDVYQRFGALTFEIWRACRLVVDVGLHHKKWTREQAVLFMLENTPNSEFDIRSEVDRYIVWPGQALAYKIGELKIKELRKTAEIQLGTNFKIREFHDKVLENGPVPLELLEQNILTWIQSKQEAT